MGQSLSRRVVPFLQRAMQRGEAEIIEEAIQEVAEKKRQALSVSRYSDPSSLLGGFTRGISDNSGDIGPNSDHARMNREREARQEEFLKQKNVKTPNEMPDDLLKFINDMGPAQRTIDESRTSKRILKKGKEAGSVEGVVEDIEKEQRNRRRQLWSTHSAANTAMIPEGDDDNFSDIQSQEEAFVSKEKTEDEKENEISYKEEQITELLKNILEQTNGNESEVIRSLEGLNKDDSTFEKISSYISYPIIMKDTDDELVGVWSHKVADLKKMGLELDGFTSIHKSSKRMKSIHIS